MSSRNSRDPCRTFRQTRSAEHERRIHSLALRATNGQDLRTPRKFYYAAKSAGCLTLAFCVTSTKQRRTEPNVGGDRPRQPVVDGGSRTLGRAPRWGANVAWGSLPRVRCATLGYDVQPRCGCREGHCQILELGTWNLEPALGLTGEASAGLVLRGWKPTTRPTYAQARGQRDLPDSSAAHRGRDS
jgi:hypothetical protein